MKITNEHYELLKKWTIHYLANKSITKQAMDEFYGGNTQRKIWDLYHAATNQNEMAKQLIQPIFNQYSTNTKILI